MEHKVNELNRILVACGFGDSNESIGTFELAVASRSVVEAIDREVPGDELRRLIRSTGAPSLITGGLKKAIDGITSIEEVTQIRWM